MGVYNLKVYEYADSVQIRMYDKAIVYSERVKPFRTFGKENDDLESVQFSERSEEQIKRCAVSSKSRTINQIYEIARANIWDYFLTLTFDRRKFDSSDYDLLCDKVSNWLHNLKKRYAPDLKYLIVPELHSDMAFLLFLRFPIPVKFHLILLNILRKSYVLLEKIGNVIGVAKIAIGQRLKFITYHMKIYQNFLKITFI